MKKLVLLAGIAMSLTACTNDEELFGGFEPPFSAAGSWKLTAMTVETPVDINNDGTASTDFLAETGCYQNELIQLLPNNTGKFISNSYSQLTVEGTFPDDVTFTQECIVELEETNITNYTILEQTISITDAEGSVFAGTLVGNTMTFIIPEGQIYFDGELNIVLQEDLTMVYTKQ
jgi:hypothetical protein